MLAVAVRQPPSEDATTVGLSEACASAELVTVFARVRDSLASLTNCCRDLGIDPIATLMTLMSTHSGDVLAPPQSDVKDSPAMVTDADVIARSRWLVDAFSRNEVAAVAPVLAPSFFNFTGLACDREGALSMLRNREAEGPCVLERTWQDERIVRTADLLVFLGRAHEIEAGNVTKGGYVHDGCYLVQWVRSEAGWKAQLLTWRKASTTRDDFNDIFLNERGYSREPNRLLVEVAKDETPGDALDLAMGQGRNALYLASRGWNVRGVDCSDVALRIARERAAESALAIETVESNIDEWDFGLSQYDLVTLIYAGDHARWIDKIKAALRIGGLLVVEGWAKTTPDSTVGFGDGQLAALFSDYDLLRDEVVDDVPDWAWDTGRLVRFVARKRR